jgi:hypothetical protein
MVALTQDAQSHLDRYLRQVNAALRSHPSVDVRDVERDVLGHIHAELAGEPEPIGAASLQRVLDRLGAPDKWVPAEDLPMWRRVFATLRSGPEDWRLAYLSLALFLAGLVLFSRMFLWPLPPLAMIASFLTARASLALLAEHDEPVGARRWLIYPSLVVWYVPMAVVLIAWPLPPAIDAVTGFPQIHNRLLGLLPEAFWLAPSAAVLAVGVWWVIFGLLLRRFDTLVRVAFWPFANWFERRHATRVALAGVLLVVLGAAMVVAVRTWL